MMPEVSHHAWYWLLTRATSSLQLGHFQSKANKAADEEQDSHSYPSLAPLDIAVIQAELQLEGGLKMG